MASTLPGVGSRRQWPMMAVIAKPAFRYRLRVLLVLSALIKVFCSFVAAGNAPAQSPLTATTIQNDPTYVGVVGSHTSPAHPLKASANNRYLVDQNDVPFLIVG